nr:uncharacterized protein LOC109770729 [Aegilops tauschii subsp. strangulata]
MSAAVPCSPLYSPVSFHLAHPPISLSPGRTGACHGLGSAPPSPENVVRHRFFDHNYRIKLPRLRSTHSRPPQPRLVVGRAERRLWPQDFRAPPAKVADRGRPMHERRRRPDSLHAIPISPETCSTSGRPMPERRRPRTRRRRVNCVPPSKQHWSWVYICTPKKFCKKSIYIGRRCTPTLPGLSYGPGLPLFTHLPGGGKLQALESLLVTGDLDFVIGTYEAKVYIFRAIPDYESDQTSDDSEDE